jgi:hypothetical protein
MSLFSLHFVLKGSIVNVDDVVMDIFDGKEDDGINSLKEFDSNSYNGN